MRTPVFELHIRPMFRLLDRDHMAFRLDLFDYDQVRAAADAILRRLKLDMPTADSGGPWPLEWVAVFERWCDTGFKRLQLGRATYAITVSGSRATLRANGTVPPGTQVWLDIVGQSDIRRDYALQVEAPDVPSAGDPIAFSKRDRFDATDMRTVWVLDADGDHEVART